MRESLEQPIVLCGLGRVGWRVLEYLRAQGFPVVVVDTRCGHDDHRLAGARLVRGDCRRKEVLEQANVAGARAVLIMTNDDLANIATALLVRHLSSEVRVVMRLFNQNLINRLGKAIRNIYALSTANLAAPLFAMTALTGQALGTIRVEGAKEVERQVAEWTVTADSQYCGSALGTLASKYELQILAHRPVKGPLSLLLDVDPKQLLRAGDRVFISGEPRQVRSVLKEGEDLLANVRWAGWMKRMGRVAWRTFTDVDIAVKVCTSVLIAVIVLSTVTLRLSVERYENTAHALFRTISIMATGGDMHEEEFAHDWQKFFVSGLRIAGAALTAAFTAIIVNYLVRARLGLALESRRIPDSGHIVVCGLGNIGFRIVEELVRCKEPVVVIEQAKESRFVTTARRLGVPVLVGDATVSGVLRQAHAAQARAVVAATSDDLINLEIALLVRELSPSKRVVLHLSDSNLAQMLREAANIRLALSIPLLAAPSFVAALFGDRVQNVFVIDGRMMATMDLVVPKQDPCLDGQRTRALAIDYRLLPVAVLDDQGMPAANPLDARLEADYRLVAIGTLPDLERLLRRELPRAEFAVEVTSLLPQARASVAALLCQRSGLSPELAEKALDQLPLCVANNLTRGQAEDLVEVLQRDSVTAILRPVEQKA